MKVELDNIELGVSPISENVYAGVSKSSGDGIKKWQVKKDVTDNFMDCVISKFGGFKTTISSSDGKKYEIIVKEIK